MDTAEDSGYQPLAEVRKSLRIEWYRSPIDRAVLKELSRRSDLKGWVQAGGHLGLFALAGALTYFFWWHQIWVGFALALFLHGTLGTSNLRPKNCFGTPARYAHPTLTTRRLLI